MRILILGGDGMLGHQLLSSFSERHDVRCTLRQEMTRYEDSGLFSLENSYFGIDANRLSLLARVLGEFQPNAVVNCVGIVKQRPEAKQAIPSLEINALLPHRLVQLLRDSGARLIHFSTDCVFNGKKGNYRESDPSDAEDLYGRTKFLGEVAEPNCLTIRTSIIGRELKGKTGLLEWFLAQEGPVKGFKRAVFSGFTTLEMARIIEEMLVNHESASGVYQVSSEPINKLDLLLKMKKLLNHDIEIVPDETFVCDRSLDSSRFRTEFGYIPPSWDAMISELRDNG